MIDLEKVNWEEIIMSAIENPQNQTANFEELREKAINENHYFSKYKVIFENDKAKLMLKIGWDKNKFFFLYESVVIDKRTNERVLGVDDAHGYRHLHSGEFITPNPTTLIEKLEHPLLSLIIKSETEERKKKWLIKLAKELKNSQKNWRKNLGIRRWQEKKRN